MRVLRRGSKGNEVKILQDLLGISVDGSFGPQTDREVRAYQKSKGQCNKSTFAKHWRMFIVDAYDNVNSST